MERMANEFVDLMLIELDYNAQFRAIHKLLHDLVQLDESLDGTIKEAEESVQRSPGGEANEHAVDQLVDLYHFSCFQGAAHSMAAVGMLAPFVESVFRQVFQPIGKTLPPGNTVRNIVNFADEVGMRSYMPDDFEVTLSALFYYRNKMFHGGFEWPKEERERFQRKLDASGWPSDWFSNATSGDEPWMFYMSAHFIKHCLDCIEQVIEGISEFAIAKSQDRMQAIMDTQPT